ncbi:MAG: YbaN family protein [Rhodocyclaceae bacterium]|nr:YbaN family protein [Rhodocyclaceae bacterium]
MNGSGLADAEEPPDVAESSARSGRPVTANNASRLHDSPLVRTMFLGLGSIALLLAVLGIFLPILPTTPFVLLAAACFARGSARLHNGLLAHRVAGPIIHEWREHRSMPPGVKPWAYLLMSLSFGISILLMESTWHRATLVAIAAALVFFLWRVPVRGN